VSVSEPIALLYGRGQLDLRMPGHAKVTLVEKGKLKKINDPAAAVRQALSEPINSPSLNALARGRKSACILICDITRPVPNHLFLRPMVETLVASGIPLSRITILVATGLHRPNLGEELAELVGDPGVMEKVRIENHYARNEADHVDLGLTATRGTPVKLDRRFVEADLRIATGLVEPHFMAGWSGGRKVVAPGVAHHETIRTFHSARFMEDPLAVQCNLIGNPLHEEQLEIVRGLGDVYALNTVIDDERALAYVNFWRDHRQSCSRGAIRGRGHSCADTSQVQDGGHVLGGISARQDLLSNDQGDGHPDGYLGARRLTDHCFGLL
jgi:nickel-dependent lactate racemase